MRDVGGLSCNIRNRESHNIRNREKLEDSKYKVELLVVAVVLMLGWGKRWIQDGFWVWDLKKWEGYAATYWGGEGLLAD